MENPNSRLLKYKRVEQQVRKLIANSRTGDKLPAERELAKMLDCNVLTVRKGMQALVNEGCLSRRVGSGTFVERVPEGDALDAMAVPGAKHIGVVNHRDGDIYSYRLIQAIAHEALRRGVELRSIWTQDYGSSLQDAVWDMARGGCESLIIPWIPPSQVSNVRSFVQDSPLQPVLPQSIPGLEHLCFEDAGVYGKSAAVEVEALYDYFLKLGAERIHFIGPDNIHSPVFQEKITAFVCRANKHGREPVFGLFDNTPEQATELARRYQPHAGNLAVISYDDAHAVRFMTAMHKLGLTAPDDYRIVGHNESSAARNTEPPLSTIRENFEYIGGAMLASALGFAAGKPVQSKRSPNPKLVVRASCGGRERIGELRIPNLDFEVDPVNAPVADAAATPV